jgi:hypothetical protein
MKVRTFSVDEANRLIPKIKDSFDDVFVLRKKISFVKNEMNWINDFWGKDLNDSDNADQDRYRQMEDELEKMHARMLSKVEKIESFGCIVKDIDTGLVDFYSIVNGDLAFLCWKYGEREIKHWHEIENGFGGRRPLSPVDSVESK